MSNYDYYEVEEILNIIPPTYSLDLTNLEDNTDTRLLTGEAIKDYLIEKYGDRKVFLLSTNATGNFLDKWNNFKYTNKHNFDVLFTALSIYYNPVENYDRKEESKITYNGSELITDDKTGDTTRTNVLGKQETIAEYGSVTDTQTLGEVNGKVTNTISAENSNIYQPDNESTTTTNAVTNTTTTGGKNDKVTINSKTDTDTNVYNLNTTSQHEYLNRNDTTESRVHGNIGVSTGADMIKKEYDVRINNLAYDILDKFAHEHMYYI